jgi:hypothetical protein
MIKNLLIKLWAFMYLPKLFLTDKNPIAGKATRMQVWGGMALIFWMSMGLIFFQESNGKILYGLAIFLVSALTVMIAISLWKRFTFGREMKQKKEKQKFPILQLHDPRRPRPVEQVEES